MSTRATYKIQGVAVLLSLFLMSMLIILILFGMYSVEARPWLDQSRAWLQTSIIFVVGIALGRSGKSYIRIYKKIWKGVGKC